MAKSEQQRQNKLAKKKSKEREKYGQLAREKAQLSSMAGAVTAAVGEPNVCLVADACSDGTGIGSVLIARPIPRGQTVMVIFLIDMFCLGVKDVVFRLGGPSELRTLIENMKRSSELRSIPPGECRSLVEGAVDYAKSLGLPAHADYRKVAGIFEGIEPLPLSDRFKFGKNGKPFFVNGPFDTQARQEQILRALTESVGEGNFHFALRFDSTQSVPSIPLGMEVQVVEEDEFDDNGEDNGEDDGTDGETSQVIEGRVVNRSN